MKNPFIQMAVMVAAFQSAFRENRMRDAKLALPSMGRTRIKGPARPAGSKLARMAAAGKLGVRHFCSLGVINR